MDNLLIPLLLVVVLVVLIVVNKRQKQANAGKETSKNPVQKAAVPRKGKNAGRTAKSTGQGKQVAARSTAKAKAAVPASAQMAGEKTDDKQGAVTTETTEDDWEWQKPAVATVSVEEVDHLTEYKVYKQFGYHDKAAESLLSYLASHLSSLSAGIRDVLVMELCEQYVAGKDTAGLADAVELYKNYITPENQEKLIREGLGIDPTNLALRVLAEECLGWDVYKTDRELGIDQGAATTAIAEDAADAETREASEKASGVPLVDGNLAFFQVREDEKEVLYGFTDPEKCYRLLKGQLPYDAQIRLLNRAIRQSEKPAALLIDALALDYRNDNVNVFAQHLWRLFYTLGQYGRKVKERMLGWGYSLGSHPIFEELSETKNAVQLREIGVENGFISAKGAAVKSKWLPVVEQIDDGSTAVHSPADEALSEAESLLNFGQFDQAMDILEKAIADFPQESPLYTALFDLYERAEEWDRLQKMLQTIKNSNTVLPEEVALVVGRLMQRFNQNGGQQS